jgi:3-isopropylmalate/(R)-2-methylmalate dehydratase small subunit
LIIKAKAIKFGDNVNTDVILPGKYLELIDPKELAKHAMAGIDPDFPNKAKDEVVIIGGKNFGCGSSREQAPLALKYSGVKCVLAEYFARIFYRNCINIGLPAIECENISKNIEEGDLIFLDLERGVIKNETKDTSFKINPIPEFLMSILYEGGLIEHLKKGVLEQ